MSPSKSETTNADSDCRQYRHLKNSISLTHVLAMALQDPRMETIKALDSFIAAQRVLLARQKDDIERLQRLRCDLRERPSEVLENLDNELDSNCFRLSTQTDLRLVLPKSINWNIFDKADTTLLHNLASQFRQKQIVLATPSKTQQSPLSELQVLVKTAKKDILDPVLERIAKGASALHFDMEEEDEEEEDSDPLERRRQEERMKIQDLKKRKVRGGGSGLTLLTPRNVVFVRDDVEDETCEVDISSCADVGRNKEKVRNKTITSTQSVSSAKETTSKSGATRNGREHKSAQQNHTCAAENGERPWKKAKILLPPSKNSAIKVRDDPSPALKANPTTPDPHMAPGDRQRDTSSPTPDTASDNPAQRPKSDTYKQAWSMDEQNLLEQLLETIPDGEKYRWLKISRAMGGRRTPRQVASRVQKYFEKLKKFGVTVD